MNQTFDILGMGWALPKTEIDNDFLHKEVGLRIQIGRASCRERV